MLPDQKIDLWYVPGWIKQTQQQQTITHPGPSNKSPNAVQNTDCLDKVQHLLPLPDRKKAKAISHHCSNSTHTEKKSDLAKPERWAGVTNPRVGRREGRVPTGSPRTPGRAAPSRQGVTVTHLLFTARHPGLRPQQGQLLRDCSYTWSSYVIYSVANKLAKTNIFSHRLLFAP